MGISTQAKAILKKLCRVVRIDGPLRSIWHKTSRYRLHVSNQELTWMREAALERENQRHEEARQREEVQRKEEQRQKEAQREEEQRQKEAQREEEQRQKEAQREEEKRQLAAQQHHDHILRIAQSVKAALGDEDSSVRVYQYFDLDPKGEQCYNGIAEWYIHDLAALLTHEDRKVTLVQVGDADSGDVWIRERDGMTILGIPCTAAEYAEVVEQLPAAPLNIYSGYAPFGKLHHPNIQIVYDILRDDAWKNADVQLPGEYFKDVDKLVCTKPDILPQLLSFFESGTQSLSMEIQTIENHPGIPASENGVPGTEEHRQSNWVDSWRKLIAQKLSQPAPRPTKRRTYILGVACSMYHSDDPYHGYVNALYWAKKNDWIVLAPESYVNRPLEYKGWMFTMYNMQSVTEEERRRIPHLLFSESLYQRSPEDSRSWTERNLDFFRYRNLQLEQSLNAQIDVYLTEHPDTEIAGFIMFGESYRSLRTVAQRYDAKMCNFDFSTVRAYGGFTTSLLLCSTNPKTFYHSEEPQKRYAAYCAENGDVPQFSRRELIALLYQADSYPLIPLLETAPRNEIGVCLGGGLNLTMFCSSEYVDEDIIREVTLNCSIDELPRRMHPASTMSTLERSRMSKSPLPFLLGCRRIAAAASNTSFEAMLWNRTAYSRGMNMPFSFMCTQDVESDELVEERFLNWFLFGYCVPGHKRLFSEDYWRWRDTHPSETEIYRRHLGIILGELGINEDMLALPEPERFVAIMLKRGCSRAAVALVQENWQNRASLRPVYEHLQSYIHIVDAQAQVYAKYESLNLQTDEGIVSRFAMERDPRRASIDFCPLQECVGFVRILHANADGQALPIAPEDRAFRCMQQYKVIHLTDPCLAGDVTLEIVWEVREVSLENLPHLCYVE